MSWWRKTGWWMATPLLLGCGVEVLRPTDPMDLTDWRLWLGYVLLCGGVLAYAGGHSRRRR